MKVIDYIVYKMLYVFNLIVQHIPHLRYIAIEHTTIAIIHS